MKLSRPLFRGTMLAFMLLISTLSFSQEHNVGDGPHGLSVSPAAVVYQDQLYVFQQGRGKNLRLEYRVLKDGEWSLQSQAPGISLTQAPCPVVYQNKLYVFHQDGGEAGDMWYTTFDGQNWSREIKIANLGMTSSPSVVEYQGKLFIFHQGKGKNGEMWYTTFDGQNFSRDTKLNDVGMSSSPGAIVYNNKIYVFHQGKGNNGEMWYSVFDGNSWSRDAKINNTALSVSPNPIVYNNNIYIFHQGSNKTGKMYYMTFDGNNFSSDHFLSEVFMSDTPGSVVYDNKIYSFYQFGSNKGYLWHTRFENNSWSHPTPLVSFSFSEEGYLDKKFGTFTIPSTHNSYIAGSLFINGNNSHDEDVPYQLCQGIRFIEMDINNIPFPFNANIERSVAIEHGKIYGGTIFGQRNVRFGIWEIKAFIESHPNEIIILKIDSPSGVSYENYKYFFQKYGIYDKMYMAENKDYANLTPRDILNAGKQILLFGGDTREMNSGIESLMNNSRSWGTNDVNNISPIAVSNKTDEKPFYVIAMYGTEDPLGFGSKSKDRIMNEYNWTKNHFLTGWRSSAMRPMSYVYDYSTYGDVMEVIHDMNYKYRSVMGKTVDINGNLIPDVKYKVTYSSDGKTIETVINGSYNFPAEIGETITITASKDGIKLSQSEFTYNNKENKDIEFNFKQENPQGDNLSNLKSQNNNEEINSNINLVEDVFPNPFTNVLNFKINSIDSKNVVCEIYDITGREVHSQNFNLHRNGESDLSIDLNQLKSGLYIYKINSGENVYSGKIIKK
ncbi:MAG: T9SS type A sorting domain-containing protein [Bacteroidales bacterium]